MCLAEYSTGTQSVKLHCTQVKWISHKLSAMPHIWMHRLIERINSALIVIQAQVQAYFRAPQKQQQLTKVLYNSTI